MSFLFSVSYLSLFILQHKDKQQYLLTFEVSSYCCLPLLHGSLPRMPIETACRYCLRDMNIMDGSTSINSILIIKNINSSTTQLVAVQLWSIITNYI